jgi:uncharacterized protein
MNVQKKSGRRGIVLRLILYPIIMYVAISTVLFFSQNGLVYYPSSEMTERPESPFEEVSLPGADGDQLHGWFFPNPEARWTVHFSHGNGGNISHYLLTAEFWRGMNCQVLIYDYPGYGKSTGRPSEAGIYRSSRVFWDWLVDARKIKPSSIVLHGRSLGGAVALETALTVPLKPAGIIMESCFRSVPALGAEIYPFLPVRFLSRNHFDNEAKITRLTIPLLVIHSPDDELVPFSHGQELYKRAGHSKGFLKIQGDHNAGFLLSDHDYRTGITKFLDSLGDVSE